MTLVRAYTPRDMAYHLSQRRNLVEQIRSAIQDSIRRKEEAGFLILNDWSTTPQVWGNTYHDGQGIRLGSDEKTLASFHTHVPSGELAANLVYTCEDAATMVKNNEPVMIVGGPASHGKFRGFAASIYTPGEDFRGFKSDVDWYERKGQVFDRVFYNAFELKRWTRTLFYELTISIPPKGINMRVLTEGNC